MPVSTKGPDPVLSDEFVLSLTRRYVPRARTVSTVDETGNRARTYMIDDDLVLKTQRAPEVRPETSLAKEVFFMERLQQDAHFRVPHVLGHGHEEGVEYTLMTRMPGVPLRSTDIEGESRRTILRELAQMLHRIHCLDLAPYLASDHFDNVSAQRDVKGTLTISLASVVERLGARPDGWTLDLTPEQVANRLLDAIATDTETVLLHGNPGPQHAYVDPKDNTFTGLIDFGDAFIGHPASELWSWRHRADQDVILSVYEAEGAVDDNFMAAWSATMVLNTLRSVAARGSAAGMPDLAHWLDRI